MQRIVDLCDRTWRKLGVRRLKRETMRDELVSDLAAAELDGVTAETYVGGDPPGFARAWGSARGVVRPRWRIGSTMAAAAVGTVPGAACHRREGVSRPPIRNRVWGSFPACAAVQNALLGGGKYEVGNLRSSDGRGSLVEIDGD